jgi:hypothetical protein
MLFCRILKELGIMSRLVMTHLVCMVDSFWLLSGMVSVLGETTSDVEWLKVSVCCMNNINERDLC